MTRRLAVTMGAATVLGLGLLIPGAASAVLVTVQPPQPNLGFSPSAIPPGGASTMTITLLNPNIGAVTGVSFSDTLPANVAVSSPPAATDTCGGTLTAPADGGSVALTGGAIEANASCVITVSVTSANTGTYVDSTGPVTATESGQASNSASATLNVANPPRITAGFSPDTVPQGADSGLFITVQNPNSGSNPPDSDVTLTGVSFSNTLPDGLVVSNSNQATSDCGGTITAAPGSSTISFTGGTIAPAQPPDNTGGVCDIFVAVRAIGQGPLVDTTGPASADQTGAGDPSNPATLNTTAPALPPGLTIAFSNPSIPLHGGTLLTETVSNPNPGASLDNVAIDDPLPAGLAVASVPAVGGTCVSAEGATVTATPGSGVVSAKTFDLAASASCTLTVTVTGTTAGAFIDTTHVPTATYDDGNALVPVSGSAASASLRVVGPPQTTVAFGAGHIPVGTGTSFTVTITNPNSTTALTGVSLALTLPGGLSFTGPAGDCAGTAATVAPGSLSLNGASLAAGASCTINETVSATTDGTKSATTSAVSSAEGGSGGAAAATLLVASPPLAIASFAPPRVPFGRGVRLWLTIRNPNRSVALTGVSMSDLLPTGLRTAKPSGVIGYCGRGTIVAADSGASIVLRGGSMPGGGHCTFSARLRLSVAGTVVDHSGTPSADETGPGTAGTASLRAAPSNRVSLRHVTALPGGRFAVTVAVPGPGHLDALLSAPTASLASLRPARGQFTYGSVTASPHRRATVSLEIAPGALGQRLLAHHHGTVRLSLHVAFTPTGGATRTIGRGGLQPI